MRATVLYGINNLFTLETVDGKRLLASLKGKILRGLEGCYNSLAPGDLVEAEEDPHDASKARILSLVPRKNLYARWNEKGRAPQALAANVDRVLLITSPRHPPFRPRFIDRVMVSCADQGLSLILILNKGDLVADDEVEERLEDYGRLGLKLLRVSAKEGRGIDEVTRITATGRSVFTGQSGVGKSSILNALEPGLGLKVGELCAKWERGAHTTILSAMFRLASGACVIDTPGFRRFALAGIEPGRLASLFPELASPALSCAYGASCGHDGEDGCAVEAAVSAGAVHPDRYESYLRMREELEERARLDSQGGQERPVGRSPDRSATLRPRKRQRDYLEEGD